MIVSVPACPEIASAILNIFHGFLCPSSFSTHDPYLHISIRLCMWLHTLILSHTYTHAYTYVYIRTHIHPPTHTYVFAVVQRSSLKRRRQDVLRMRSRPRRSVCFRGTVLPWWMCAGLPIVSFSCLHPWIALLGIDFFLFLGWVF